MGVSMRRRAVVLLNLGGPDSPDAVRPFLFNLFNDPAIIGAPAPIRRLLASLISRRRAPLAREIYARIGGRSPLLPETRAQAAALQQILDDDGGTRVFVAMRYWHPFVEQAVEEVAAFGPDEVVLLPLYPQFSTTTTASSWAAWDRAAARIGARWPTRTVCCYPAAGFFVQAYAERIAHALDGMEPVMPVRVLFSAHGLPERVVAKGDPYQWQVEQTAAAIVQRLDRPDLDWMIGYQSRVGPLAWIKPATDAEIRRAGAEGKALVVVPIAFVSEHSETLVELDLEYGKLARDSGVPDYRRIATVGADASFIGGLADLVNRISAQPAGRPCPDAGKRICPQRFTRCPCPVD